MADWQSGGAHSRVALKAPQRVEPCQFGLAPSKVMRIRKATLSCDRLRGGLPLEPGRSCLSIHSPTSIRRSPFGDRASMRFPGTAGYARQASSPISPCSSLDFRGSAGSGCADGTRKATSHSGKHHHMAQIERVHGLLGSRRKFGRVSRSRRTRQTPASVWEFPSNCMQPSAQDSPQTLPSLGRKLSGAGLADPKARGCDSGIPNSGIPGFRNSRILGSVAWQAVWRPRKSLPRQTIIASAESDRGAVAGRGHDPRQCTEPDRSLRLPAP
jgi:hypothetical protein